MQQPTAVRGPLLLGSVLVVIGIVLLLGQQLALRVDWLTWPIIGGVAIFVIAVAIGGDTGSGFAALAGIITTAGLVMAVQRETGAYASWTYAWALVAPGGVGLGLAAYGALTGRWDLARGGVTALVVGIVLFLVGLLFFEGAIGLSGDPDAESFSLIVPGLIMALGAVLLLAALVTPRWRSKPSPSGVSGEAFAAVQTPVAGDDPLAGSIDLGAAAAADVAIAFGAGRLAVVGPAAPGHLVDGTFRGGVKREEDGPGRVKLSTPGERVWQIPWNEAPFDWRLGLTDAVPLRLDVQVGAAQAHLDLSSLRVSELRLRTGAAETWVTLPAGAGATTVEAEGGAAAVHFRVPDGAAARIRSTMVLGSTSIDERRFPRDPLGGWSSPDHATAANRVELEFRGGVGSLSVS